MTIKIYIALFNYTQRDTLYHSLNAKERASFIESKFYSAYCSDPFDKRYRHEASFLKKNTCLEGESLIFLPT